VPHRAKETEIGGPEKGFPSTHWSTVLRAGDPASAERRIALEKLIEAYWKPVYHYLRRRGNDPERSKDLTQSFFAAVLERKTFKDVTESGGRFRTFLLVVLRNFLSDENDRATAQKRGGGAGPIPLDFASAESNLPWTPASKETPDAIFRRSWALRVMAQAWDSLRAHYESEGRREEYELFRDHLGADADAQVSYEDLARRLGLTESDVRNRLHAARHRIAAAIRDVVRSYTDTEEDAREELRDLLSAFS
jgi:RNA polymerase sigma-70 factor (ECF subfamily)